MRLEIDAPKEVTVHRREIYEAIKEAERLSKAQDKDPASSQ